MHHLSFAAPDLVGLLHFGFADGGTGNHAAIRRRSRQLAAGTSSGPREVCGANRGVVSLRWNALNPQKLEGERQRRDI